MYPSYLSAFENNRLPESLEIAFSILEKCILCPRKCGVNRLKGEVGFCKVGLNPKVSTVMPHFGEEPAISGKNGSGTIFFSNCNMRCVYCQNFELSQKGEGREVNFQNLADYMLQLQQMGCHNINLVTPTHFMPQILKALSIAIPLGLNIPLVYNTGGYELPEIIKLLDGIVDIYMPDMRYAYSVTAKKYSQAINYPKFNQASILEMQRQVGIAHLDKKGIMKHGLLIRHLVLPNHISGTEEILRFISKKISPLTHISLMSQYFPCYLVHQFPELERIITQEEYQEAIDLMAKLDLNNGWIQESGGLARFAGTNIKPNIA